MTETKETMTAILLHEDAEYYECFNIITGLPDDMDTIKQIAEHLRHVHISESYYTVKIVKINKADVIDKRPDACCETIWQPEEQHVNPYREIGKNFIHMKSVRYWSIKSYADWYFLSLDPVINARNAIKELIKQAS